MNKKFVHQQIYAHFGENSRWVYCDIDNTLLNNDSKINIPNKLRIKMCLLGKTYYLKPNSKNIEKIKKLFKRGFTCVAWSAAGEKWAKQAVKKLKLTKYFKYILCKPTYIIDDKETEEWIGINIFNINDY